MKRAHVITIVVLADGSVQGDLDYDIIIWPKDAKVRGSNSIYSACQSVLDQALKKMVDVDSEK